MSKNATAKLNPTGNQFSLPNLWYDSFPPRASDPSFILTKRARKAYKRFEGQNRKTVRAVTYQLCFNGDVVKSEISISIDSIIWAKLPKKRQAS